MGGDEVLVRYLDYEDMVRGILTIREGNGAEEAIDEVGGELVGAFG